MIALLVEASFKASVSVHETTLQRHVLRHNEGETSFAAAEGRRGQQMSQATPLW